MSDSNYHIGMVIHTEADGRQILCIHPETAIPWLQKLIVGNKGWARFQIKKKSIPKGKITHTLQQVDISTSDIYARTTKPDYPEETKAESW
jgi:hypothetical protein